MSNGVNLSFNADGSVSGMSFTGAAAEIHKAQNSRPKYTRAPRGVSRGRFGGMMISVEGLEKLGVDLDRFEKHLPLAIRASLQGEGGTALELDMKRRMPRKTGKAISSIDKHADAKTGGVMVGYLGAEANSHIVGARFQLGAWIESGTKPHKIRAKKKGESLLIAGGRFVSEVDHPGTRPKKVASKAIRAVEWEILADVVDQLDRIPGGVRV